MESTGSVGVRGCILGLYRDNGKENGNYNLGLRVYVSKTDSAARSIHAPARTGLQCPNGRSQHRKKAQPMTILKALLYERVLQRRADEAQQTSA